MTIEDVANLLMLPILRDVDPTRLRLTTAESMIEEELIENFGGKGASFGRNLAKHSTWVNTFCRRSNESEKYVRCADFVAFWLTKFMFCEHPHYAMQPSVFRLTIKIFSSNYFPLAPIFLGHLYTHLDLLHADELVGASCRVVAFVINMSLLQACLWERLKEYRSKCKKLKDVATKFEKMPFVIADKCVGFRQGFPIIFKWSGTKGLAGLMDSLDKGTGFTWRPYSNLVLGFASRSLLLLMHSSAIGASGLKEGNMI